jgi:hypothetical protein
MWTIKEEIKRFAISASRPIGEREGVIEWYYALNMDCLEFQTDARNAGGMDSRKGGSWDEL